jgi:hypothetical protein
MSEMDTTNIKERLKAAHARDLRAAIEGHYDSDPIFTDALAEIEALESRPAPLLETTRYAGLVVDLLNREDGSVKRVMLYPATRVELQQWTGGGWETQETWDCHGEGAPGGIDPVKWVGAPYTK